MSERFPDDCPTLTRDGTTVGFSPSPDGMSLWVWWRDTDDRHTDSEVIGAFPTYEAGVAGALKAIADRDIATAGTEPDPDVVKVEAQFLEKTFTETDWMGLGF
ncbi:hypothetical protein [Williamsia herbipolensis]|uniref:hypothetical protein n=1 Tax=Williamsia herbipolensis TaxID=1603258 RepID=UPI0005F7BAFC|nr:hypothetical protein [Williamsia herbipolensis]